MVPSCQILVFHTQQTLTTAFVPSRKTIHTIWPPRRPTNGKNTNKNKKPSHPRHQSSLFAFPHFLDLEPPFRALCGTHYKRERPPQPFENWWYADTRVVQRIIVPRNKAAARQTRGSGLQPMIHTPRLAGSDTDRRRLGWWSQTQNFKLEFMNTHDLRMFSDYHFLLLLMSPVCCRTLFGLANIRWRRTCKKSLVCLFSTIVCTFFFFFHIQPHSKIAIKMMTKQNN